MGESKRFCRAWTRRYLPCRHLKTALDSGNHNFMSSYHESDATFPFGTPGTLKNKPQRVKDAVNAGALMMKTVKTAAIRSSGQKPVETAEQMALNHSPR